MYRKAIIPTEMQLLHFKFRKAMVRAAACAVMLFGALVPTGAHAQLGLPQVQPPSLPGNAPLGIDPARPFGLPQRIIEPAADAVYLRLRKNQDLLRRYPDRIEADPKGQPVVRGELVAYSPSPALLDKAREEGFVVVRQQAVPGLDESFVVLRPPNGVSTRDGLRRLRELAPDDALDFNHLYGESASTTSEREKPPTPSEAVRPANGATPLKVGLIDSGVDGNVEALRDVRIHREGCSGHSVPNRHGTAVASIMVGKAERFRGAAPGADLYAADVYCDEPTGGALDAIVAAFAWMARENVAVVNVSLVGPANRVLERIVARMIARGHLIVAAVGNEGPAAPPLYPAAYPGVVGATAVDGAARALPEAARGAQVAFAAPGADMAAANIDSGYVIVRGTSFAAPIVAGLLASLCDRPDAAAAQHAVAQLKASAADLGERGKDPVYGDGLVGQEVRVIPSRVAAREMR